MISAMEAVGYLLEKDLERKKLNGLFKEKPFCIMNADCMVALRDLPYGSLDLILTDPPF